MFTETQQTQLLKPIAPQRVLADGKGHSHVSQQDVTAHLIRMFGFGGFDTEILSAECVFEEPHLDKKGVATPGRWDVCYRASLRLTVKDEHGQPVATYEDGSTATAQNQTRGDAHDLAYKGLSLDTEIPTPTGWTTMGSLAISDHVFDRDGQHVRVQGVSEVKHLDCYRVVFRNGHAIVCDADHQWVATVAQEREKVHPVADLFAAKAAGKRVVIPMTAALQTASVDLPLDPWLLGYWLGNGSRSAARLTTHGEDVDAVVTAIVSAGHRVGAVRISTNSNSASLGILGITKILAEIGVLGHKHVPAQYMRSSIAQRRALLAGLMDSDGSADRRSGRVTFVNTDHGIAASVAELARSLGEHVTVTQVDGHGYGKSVRSWNVQWRPLVIPFALPRKASNCRTRSKVARNIVAAIERVESVPTRCISVDSPSRTFLASRDMVPTHNSALSLAKKRCAINLGDQFGLSLYNKGQRSALVLASLVGAEPAGWDVQEGVPQQVVLGNDETDYDPAAGDVTGDAVEAAAVDPVEVERFGELIAAATTGAELTAVAALIAGSRVSGEAREQLRARFSQRSKELAA
jgi:hypothetical protein